MSDDDDIGIELDRSKWELIFQGAESRVYSGQYNSQAAIMKERFEKKYRHPELDRKLTKERIKAEIKAYEKISKKCGTLAASMPKILFSDNRTIVMTRVNDACNVSEFIHQNETSQPELVKKILAQIGVIIGKIHKCNLVHGDLTTSNFLVKIVGDNQEVIPIDFGLASQSTSNEDRAVDLYVLERAFESTHPKVEFGTILESYEKEMGTDTAIKRLAVVRSRGRKRLAIG